MCVVVVYVNLTVLAFWIMSTNGACGFVATSLMLFLSIHICYFPAFWIISTNIDLFQCISFQLIFSNNLLCLRICSNPFFHFFLCGSCRPRDFFLFFGSFRSMKTDVDLSQPISYQLILDNIFFAMWIIGNHGAC